MRRIFLFGILWLAFCMTAAAQADSIIANYLAEEYNVRFTPGNTLRLLPYARDKYAALEADLRSARHSIHMDYFNMRDDSISRVMFDILRERAAAGVEVRVIIDAFGNGKSAQALRINDIRRLRREGVDVRIFDRMHFPWVNHFLHRDHRKIVVIDGAIGYIGGMNIADYYIHGKGDITQWRDMHLRISGPAVNDLQRVFVKFWNQQTEEDIQGEAYYYHPSGDEQGALVGVVNRTPSKGNDWPIRNNRIARDAARQAIDAATSHIQIVNPYFAPSPMIRRALRRALKRGVDVELMISAQSDVKITPRAVELCAYKLMKHGARVYVYEPGFHHSKVLTIDDKVAYVGSVNLDHRSLYSDYECNLMVIDKALVRDLQDIFNADKARSFQLTPETRKTRFSRGKRIRGRLATIFRPLL